jgi:NADH:ubiquinone oxidoreductase subunit 4 (subunit M)
VAQNSLLLILGILTLGLFVSISLAKWHIEAALVTSFLALYVGLYSCLFFDKGATGFQFFNHFTLQPFYKVDLMLGVDGISFTFLLLTLFIFPYCFIAARSIPEKGAKAFCSYLIGMEILLVLTFTITDLFYFYIFFESLLIPIFIIIGV